MENSVRVTHEIVKLSKLYSLSQLLNFATVAQKKPEITHIIMAMEIAKYTFIYSH